jgi:MFS family permease
MVACSKGEPGCGLSASKHSPGERTLRRRLLVLTALRWFPGGMVLPVLVLLMQSKDLELAQIGTLFAAFGIMVAAFELPTGGLADAIGQKPILLASSVLTAAAFGLFAMANSMPMFAAGFVVFALGRAMSSGPLQAWFVDAAQTLQPRPDIRSALAQESLVRSFTIGAGAVLGGVTPVLWRRFAPSATDDVGLVTPLSVPVWFASGALLAVTLAVVVLMRPSRPVTDRARSVSIWGGTSTSIRTGLHVARRNRGVLRILVSVTATGFAISATELLAPSSMASLLGSPERASALYGLLVTASFIATGVGSGLAPEGSRRLGGAMRNTALALVLGAAAYSALAAAPDVAVFAGAYLVIYFVLGTVDPLRLEQLHHRFASNQRATMLSIESLAMMGGGALGAVVSGQIVERFGYAYGWFACAVMFVLSAVVIRTVPDYPASDVRSGD